jgi:hypothetical protein
VGLAEKRKIKELQENDLPARTAELLEITGAPISYDVDWESFDTLEALNFLDNIACHRLNMALRVICSDELGKEAVGEALQTIRLVNTEDENGRSISLDNGVLQITIPFALGTGGYFSDGEIRQYLMGRL